MQTLLALPRAERAFTYSSVERMLPMTATEMLLREYSKNGVHPQEADHEFEGVEIRSSPSNSPGSTFCSVNCDCCD